jgi:hypothetical protein
MSSLVSLRLQQHSVCRTTKDFYSCIDADTTAPLVPAVPSSSLGWCPPTHTVYCPGTRCEEPSARAVVSCEASRGTRNVVESPLATWTCCVVVVIDIVVVILMEMVWSAIGCGHHVESRLSHISLCKKGPKPYPTLL